MKSARVRAPGLNDKNCATNFGYNMRPKQKLIWSEFSRWQSDIVVVFIVAKFSDETTKKMATAHNFATLTASV